MQHNSRQTIIYVAQVITEVCLEKRRNDRHFSQAGFNKSLGMASLICEAGFNVQIISPSLVNRKTGYFFKSFNESLKSSKIFHASVWDITGVHLITAIISLCCWLFQNRSQYQKIIFYNYRPETAIPAFFAKAILGKKIYLEYEDGYFAFKINPVLKIFINILEKLGNLFISGAVVVHPGLASRLKTSNIQVIPGILDKDIRHWLANLPPKSIAKKIIMYAGALDEIRGVDIFLPLAEQIIKTQEGDYEFWISGKGPLEPVVRAFSSKYPDKIKFFGFVSHEELLKIYQEVDAFVSLQKPEIRSSQASYPSKIYEFKSTGRIVIGEEYSLGRTTLQEIFNQITEVIRGEQNEKRQRTVPFLYNLTIFQ